MTETVEVTLDKLMAELPAEQRAQVDAYGLHLMQHLARELNDIRRELVAQCAQHNGNLGHAVADAAYAVTLDIAANLARDQSRARAGATVERWTKHGRAAAIVGYVNHETGQIENIHPLESPAGMEPA